MMKRMALGLTAALLCGVVASQVRASTYTFESLNVGTLAGQDNWTSYSGGGAVITPSGTGNPSSRVFTATGGTGNESFGSRINDGNFSIPTFTGSETAVVFQADFRASSTGPNQATAGLGRDVNNNGSVEAGAALDEVNPVMGIYFIGSLRFFLVRDGAGTIYADVAPPAGFSVGDWIRLRMDIDLTANGGDGSGSVSAQNLTTGGAFVPVVGMQNVNIHLTDGPGPSLWNAMYIESFGGDDNGGESDNFTVLVPEPASVMLLAMGGLVALRRTRR